MRSSGSRIFFLAFLLSVVFAFFSKRELNTRVAPYITGDGFGYYAYLPAEFIYHDHHLRYHWFNEAYKAHYGPGSFLNPEDNLLINYQGKRINKYYPGLSLIWLPFFLLGHGTALILEVPADGFSWPYQIAIGLASLCWLLLGLTGFRRLLLSVFPESDWVAALIPCFIFYGTHLFVYAIDYNSLSHIYSFTLTVWLLYHGHGFFNGAGERRKAHLTWMLLLLALSATVRPLNLLILLVLPVFIPAGFKFEKAPWRKGDVFRLIAAGIIAAWTLVLMHQQTGHLFAYTYGDEHFDFSKSHFWNALIGYDLGLIVYAPVFMLALIGSFYLPLRHRWIVPVFFLGILFLYSGWWYWMIVRRTLIDFYALPGLMLAALFVRAERSRSLFLSVFTLCMVCCAYFQLKAYQVRRGVLDEFNTYKAIFWKDFWNTRATRRYLVQPRSILQQHECLDDYEVAGNRPVSNGIAFTGHHALQMDQLHYIFPVMQCQWPAIYTKPAYKKIRFSMNVRTEYLSGEVHVFMRLKRSDGGVLREDPFYLKANEFEDGDWVHKEFGMEFVPGDDTHEVKEIEVIVWDVNQRGMLWIDDAKMEFMVTDPKFETVK